MWIRYCLGAFSYGLVRKLKHVQRATLTKDVFDSENKVYMKQRIPMPHHDKIFIATYSAYLAVFILPYFVYKDIFHKDECEQLAFVDPSNHDIIEFYKYS
jgi:hypothetical protein